MPGAILGYGVYLPRYRIKREEIAGAWGGRGRGENTVAHVNEDIITMAIEAAQNALDHAGVAPEDIEAIYLGTDSAPNIEQSSVGLIAQTLGVPSDADLVDLTASPRAGVAALKACLDALNSGRIKAALVIGSDNRQPPPGSDLELNFGSGAAAIVLGRSPGIAEVEDIFTYTTSFRDTWRAVGDNYVRLFEPRFTREYGYSQHIAQAVKGLLNKLERSIGEFNHVILQQPDERMPRGVARGLGVETKRLEAGFLFPQTGDLGTASVLVGLCAVLDRAEPGEKVLAASYGSGTSDALALRVTEKKAQRWPVAAYLASKEYVPYTDYLKKRKLLREEEPPAKMGLPPMSPLLSREGEELLCLIGGKCRRCGYVNFPPSERKICVRCGYTEFDRVLLPRRGKIHTFCISYYLPPGFDEVPLPVIVADLEDGTRHRALGTEMKPDEIQIDRAVELVVRRLATEDNANLYGNVFRFPRIE